MADAREIARGRYERHRGHSTVPRVRAFDQEYVGVIGEIEFARTYGLPTTPIYERRGGPVDFRMGGFRFDVKTFVVERNKRKGMLVRKDELPADIYVCLSMTHGANRAELLGWAWRRDVTAGEDFLDAHYRIPSYRLSVDELWRMDDLLPEMERVAAEEYARMMLREHRTRSDGHSVVVTWWTNERSAAVEIDGKTLDYVYAASRDGGDVWFAMGDDESVAHRSPHAAINAVVGRFVGNDDNFVPMQRMVGKQGELFALPRRREG